MRELPEALTTRPFHRREALALGVTSRMLQGRRFVRLMPRVFHVRGLELTEQQWLDAARLALPPKARVTGVTRLRFLGLSVGSLLPLHFVLPGELHLAFDHVVLHRTVLEPPLADDGDVTPAAAFLAYCRRATTWDAVAVGDWLLHRGHMTLDEVEDLVDAQWWRDGAAEAAYVLPHLDGRSRSLPESRVRCLVVFAGLPAPEVNASPSGHAEVHGDLLFRPHRVVVEYEGGQHQEDRAQYLADLDRYADFRRGGTIYVQITKEHLAVPRTCVRRIHEALVLGGYDGPAPEFGELFDSLFVPVRRTVGHRFVHRAGRRRAA